MGPKDAMELVAFEGAITSRNDILIEWTDKEQLDVFCNLASQRVFNPKPSFVLFNLDEATIADLEERYDVGFVLRDDGKSHSVIF